MGNRVVAITTAGDVSARTPAAWESTFTAHLDARPDRDLTESFEHFSAFQSSMCGRS